MFVFAVNALVMSTLTAAATEPAAASPTANPVRIVAFGDSLTAGYMLPPSDSFPAQLAKVLAARGHAVDVVNAGVSGDTTGTALERFDWAVPDGTDGVILELGANDALRGIDPAIAKAALEAIIGKLKARNIEVLLAGMKAPRNWGPEYQAEFDGMYADLATRNGLILYPFFLEGIAMQADLNLSDGMHPNTQGVAKIVERMLPSVESLIEKATARRSSTASKS